jgi:hypothetical protein
MPSEETSSLTPAASDIQGSGLSDDGGRILASAALIGAGVLVEPELLGGALLGAGVVYGLPLVGRFLRPVATMAVQLGYTTVAGVSDLLVGARDQVQGIVATARSEYQRSRGPSIIKGE